MLTQPTAVAPAHPSSLALPTDKTIGAVVIAGPSKGLTHRLSKPQISIGRSGGGADIEIDDPGVSPTHCAVGVSGYRRSASTLVRIGRKGGQSKLAVSANLKRPTLSEDK